jgi:hypothetical protein
MKILGFETYYPVGKPYNTERRSADTSKIGFYNCTVNFQLPDKMNVIAKRGDTLDWKFKGKF